MTARRALDVLKIDDPCPASFADMSGIGAVRYCKLCHENVYDLSQMTRREAEDLIYEAEGRICVQFYARADGTVVTKDCAPVRFAAARRAARRSLALATTVVGGLLAFVVTLAGVFTFWRDEKPEWIVAAKEMVSPGPAMIPLPPEPEPVVEPIQQHQRMRGGVSRVRHLRTDDGIEQIW